MANLAPSELALNATTSDEEIAARVLSGETLLYELIMRRNNQRLYRAARAILRNDADAEEVVQATYVRAYERLPQFAGRASFAAWLIRIAVNEALAQLRSRKRFDEEGEGDAMGRLVSQMPTPEQGAAASEMRRLLEVLIEALPVGNRAVFILRDVEGLSTAETAEALEITEENVKTRLHRSRAALRKGLSMQAISEVRHAFAFHAIRCDRVVKNVLDQIV